IEDFAISDPELEAKFRFYGDRESAVALGAAVFFSAPLGRVMAEDAFIGSESVTAGGRFIVDGINGPLSYGVNVGYRYQGRATIVSELGSEALFGAAAAFAVTPTVRLLADAFGTTQFDSEPGTTSAEVLIAAQFSPLMSPWTVTLGGGPGLVQGAIGVPVARGALGVSYTHEQRDEDGDGILPPADLCPAAAEDFDGFEDADGCPDLDNDGDTIADDMDKCPMEPEDRDGFQDLDGCPDPDNDQDGILDIHDRCPLEPEN